MKHFNTPYPFSAIVGQEIMKKALLLNAINPKIGGVLIKGEKGTAKSTAVRALADILLDRFGLCAEIEGINDAEARVEIIKRRMDYEKYPEGFAKEWGKKDEELRERIVRAKGLLPAVKVEEDMLKLIARICIDMQVDGHRADIAMMKTAATIAAYHQRNEVTEGDVKEAAELVLPHRMRRKPFSEQKMEQEKLEQSIQKHKEQKQKHEHEHTQNQNPSL